MEDALYVISFNQAIIAMAWTGLGVAMVAGAFWLRDWVKR